MISTFNTTVWKYQGTLPSLAELGNQRTKKGNFMIITFILFIFFKFYFIFKLYITVLVLPNIKMNPPQVYMCSPS